MENRICKYCGKSFTVSKPSRKTKCCSRKCGLFIGGQTKSKNLGYPGVNRICKNCSKPFTVSNPSVKNETCSNKCAVTLRWKQHNKDIEQLLPEIKKYRKNHTPQETSDKFKISHSVLLKWGVLGPGAENRYALKYAKLSIEQQEIVNGNLLGDGSIPHNNNNRANNKFTINQKKDNVEYINSLYDIYSPFSIYLRESKKRKPSKVNGKINHDIENWGGEYSYSVTMYTISHPIFTELRNKWYEEPNVKNSKKIIPFDLRLTWRTVAFWACDDGSNCNTSCPSSTSQYPTRKFTFYTDCFTKKEVEFLIDRLKIDINITAKLTRRKDSSLICVYGDEQVKLVQGIKPFIPWKCFNHKCNYRLLNNKHVTRKS